MVDKNIVKNMIVGNQTDGSYPHFDFVCHSCNEQTNTYECDYIILGRVVGFVCNKCNTNNYLNNINKVNL
jgi:hypothetical protein